jgi:anti-anti-sigma factor
MRHDESNGSWRYAVHTAASRRLIILAGDIDFSAAAPVRDILVQSVIEAARVEVDLRRVTFLDSSGISALVAARNAADAAGRTFVVRNPSDPARNVLALTGVLDILVTDSDQSGTD